MKTLVAALLCCVTLLGCASGDNTHDSAQSRLDGYKKIVSGWAADPTIVKAVRAQNHALPIAAMTNAKWLALPPGDAAVEAIQKNEASKWLREHIAGTNGLVVEAFVCAAKSEKAAFAQKPTYYFHAGMPKFEVPMTGKMWQSEPMFDDSTKTSQVQIATPVLDGGKPIGVLVVGFAAEKFNGK